jgi:hypothetical protein
VEYMDRTILSISECYLILTRGSQSVIFSLVGQISLRSHRPSGSLMHQTTTAMQARQTVVQNVLISYMPDGSDRPITTHKTQATINLQFKE